MNKIVLLGQSVQVSLLGYVYVSHFFFIQDWRSCFRRVVSRALLLSIIYQVIVTARGKRLILAPLSFQLFLRTRRKYHSRHEVGPKEVIRGWGYRHSHHRDRPTLIAHEFIY